MSKTSKLKCNIKTNGSNKQTKQNQNKTKNPHVSLNLQYIRILKQIVKVRKLWFFFYIYICIYITSIPLIKDVYFKSRTKKVQEVFVQWSKAPYWPATVREKLWHFRKHPRQICQSSVIFAVCFFCHRSKVIFVTTNGFNFFFFPLNADICNLNVKNKTL